MLLAKPGDRVDGRYTVLRQLGSGSTAEVYEAFDDHLQHPVALKLIHSQVVRDPAEIQRLEREFEVQGQIRHNNVARILGGGVTPRGQAYLTVELLRGRSLRDVIKQERRVDLVRAASYAWQALQGLTAIHAAGVIHRDLKPANLMLEPSPGPVERVVLIDFGYAAMTGQSRLTRQGHVVGSLAYVPPERIMGAVGDARADLYGLAIILYELIAGRRPFVADSEAELISMQLETQPPPPSVIAPDAGIPVAFDLVVLRAMQKQPEARYASAAEMATAIEAAMSALP